MSRSSPHSPTFAGRSLPSALQPRVLADYLAPESAWDIQVATVGLTPLAPTMNRRSTADDLPSPDSTLSVPSSPWHRATHLQLPPEVDPEPPDLNVAIRHIARLWRPRRHSCHKRGCGGPQGLEQWAAGSTLESDGVASRIGVFDPHGVAAVMLT
jgi:hypothetical protein